MCTTLDVYKPKINFQLSNISFTAITKAHDDNKAIKRKDFSVGKQKENAFSGIVEKPKYTNAKTNDNMERERLKLDLAASVRYYNKNQSFYRAYIIELNIKVKETMLRR